MAATITFNPYATSVSQSSFLLQTDGFVQGVFLDSPTTRYALEGGYVAASQATPIWGGLPLSIVVPAPGAGGSSSNLGAAVTLATALANIDGWSLLNQSSAGVITSTSPSPLYPSGASINFGRVGSGMLVCLPVNPAAVNTIASGASNQAIYWNYTNNYVDVTGTGALGLQIYALNTNSKTISYNTGTGAASWVNGGSVIVVRI
jgi:hypothetical protein